eukprot:337308-Hanusia_phi.AAC.1
MDAMMIFKSLPGLSFKAHWDRADSGFHFRTEVSVLTSQSAIIAGTVERRGHRVALGSSEFRVPTLPRAPVALPCRLSSSDI